MRLLGRHRTGGASPQPTGPMLELPERLAKVRIRLVFASEVATADAAPGCDCDCGLVELPSRVEEIEEPTTPQGRVRLLISPPDVEFLPAPIDLSIEHTLLWITANSQMELPVRVQSTDSGLWPLIVQGPARKVQRRRFVRIPIRLPGQLTQIKPAASADADVPDDVPEDGSHQWPVTILDIGEGGVCCLIRADNPPAAGSAISVSFQGVDGDLLTASGVIVRHLAAPGDPTANAIALAIRFDNPEEHGDTVRRLVFAEQLRQRQTRLDAQGR